MDRLPIKRLRLVIPKQMKDARVGHWDDHGGVFTQENPSKHALSRSKLNFSLWSFFRYFIKDN
jgi:hypothetical protein